MTCPRCAAPMVQYANLGREPFAQTLQCDCGYSEPASAGYIIESALRAIKEYATTVAD